MPWHVAKSDSCPPSKPWACVADMTGEVMGCHASQTDAQAQVDALYANEPMAMMSGAAVNKALREAGQLRAAAAGTGRTPTGTEFRSQTVPGGQGRQDGPRGELRGQIRRRDGKDFYVVGGYATMYERGYPMYDWAGPYEEVVGSGAGRMSLAAKPDVSFLVNHKGLTLARTSNNTLRLWEDNNGLANEAWLNPQRDEVRNLMLAIDDGLVSEQSFAFHITNGEWSDDFTQFRINSYDINRGDVSAVNYGANPFTTIAARSPEILDALDELPVGAAREAIARLTRRLDEAQRTPVQPATTTPTDEARQGNGRSLRIIEAWIATGK